MGEPKPYTLRIDGQLLRSQRRLLLKMIDTTFHDQPFVPKALDDRAIFEGIISLLD